MRTTLTLDDDLASQLKEMARRGGDTFKDVVNATVRLGLREAKKQEARLPPFVVKAKACGFHTGVDPLKLNQLVDELEIEHFRGNLLRDLASR